MKKKSRKPKNNFNKKHIQKYEEYFPRGNNDENEDFVFNFAPVKKLTKK